MHAPGLSLVICLPEIDRARDVDETCGRRESLHIPFEGYSLYSTSRLRAIAFKR